MKEESERDIEIIKGVPTHASCIIRLYNIQAKEVDLAGLERLIVKKRNGKALNVLIVKNTAKKGD